ncbi:hypothetical protein [Ralstonia insidiosa]|uniref:Uncharacterized protein n=1 Tax=Ralstonia insidiosa TaxID=190721 RepID=A0A848NW95_9RALS|nr:hypothetical protein [Ralstonia insidiosa]NMV37609.1 hypothetical protein [Ralstonia insidiosa]
MSHHKLETLGFVSLVASETFVLHPNFEHQKFNWVGLLIGSIAFAILLGTVADLIYNKILPEKDSGGVFLRSSLLYALYIIMFGIAFLAGRFIY